METGKHTELRHEKCRLRNEISSADRARENEIIFEKLTASEQYQEADVILIYASYRSEADTFRIIRHALEKNKKVYCPKVEGERLVFYRIYSIDDLVPGYRSIPEPDGTGEEYQHQEKAVLIAPGTVFDQNGHRIGYGGGFYDRYLSGFSEAERPFYTGICFACQITEKIKPMEHDVAMDLVVHS